MSSIFGPNETEIRDQRRMELRARIVTAPRSDKEDAIASAPDHLFKSLDDAIAAKDLAWIGEVVIQIMEAYPPFQKDAEIAVNQWASNYEDQERARAQRITA